MRRFEEWEKAFILLTYPEESYKNIASYMNRSKNSIEHFLKKNADKRTWKHTKYEIGEKINNLTISGYWPDENHMYECICNLCGQKTKVITSSILRRGVTKSCKCVHSGPRNPDMIIPQWYFTEVQRNARARNHEFKITLEYMINLFIKQDGKCALSGLKIEHVHNNYKSNRKYKTASLDRIDSSKGYIEGNVQWIHKKFQQMKMDSDEKDFKQGCREIVDYETERMQKLWRCQ